MRTWLTSESCPGAVVADEALPGVVPPPPALLAAELAATGPRAALADDLGVGAASACSVAFAESLAFCILSLCIWARALRA